MTLSENPLLGLPDGVEIESSTRLPDNFEGFPVRLTFANENRLARIKITREPNYFVVTKTSCCYDGSDKTTIHGIQIHDLAGLAQELKDIVADPNCIYLATIPTDLLPEIR